MGIDDVDKWYAKPKPVRLECEHCSGTGGDVKRRPHWYHSEVDAVLCARCWSTWTPVIETETKG